MEQKLHTPEGVRDIYSKECEIKLALQKKLSKVLHLYGYQDIQTPTLEYYEVFRKEIGSTSTQELYKLFDREGNILALRPDITPPVARAAATLFENEEKLSREAERKHTARCGVDRTGLCGSGRGADRHGGGWVKTSGFKGVPDQSRTCGFCQELDGSGRSWRGRKP